MLAAAISWAPGVVEPPGVGEPPGVVELPGFGESPLGPGSVGVAPALTV